MTNVIMGIFLTFLFVVIGAFQDVFLASYFQTKNPLLTVFSAFLIGMLVFWALLGRGVWSSFQRVSQEKKLFLLLNFYTTLNWLTFFYSLKYIEPVLAGAIAFSLLPAITVILNAYFRPNMSVSFLEKLSSLGILASILLLVYGEISQVTSLAHPVFNMQVIGVLLCILTSIGMSYNTFITKELSDKKFRTTEVMAFRFIALCLVSFIFLKLGGATIPIYDFSFLGVSLLVGVVGVVIPMFIIQKAIEKTEPVIISIILALTPGVTFLFEVLEGRIEMRLTSAVGAMMCCFFAIVGVFPRKKNEIVK
ncbi:MAG: DMT family transporter [Bdellovibrionota bacterium]